MLRKKYVEKGNFSYLFGIMGYLKYLGSLYWALHLSVGWGGVWVSQGLQYRIDKTGS